MCFHGVDRRGFSKNPNDTFFILVDNVCFYAVVQSHDLRIVSRQLHLTSIRGWYHANFDLAAIGGWCHANFHLAAFHGWYHANFHLTAIRG